MCVGGADPLTCLHCLCDQGLSISFPLLNLRRTNPVALTLLATDGVQLVCNKHLVVVKANRPRGSVPACLPGLWLGLVACLGGQALCGALQNSSCVYTALLGNALSPHQGTFHPRCQKWVASRQAAPGFRGPHWVTFFLNNETPKKAVERSAPPCSHPASLPAMESVRKRSGRDWSIRAQTLFSKALSGCLGNFCVGRYDAHSSFCAASSMINI